MRLPTNTTYDAEHLLKLACYEAVVDAISRNEVDKCVNVLEAAQNLHKWVTEDNTKTDLSKYGVPLE